ncbi:Zinc finger FYVE/PHD-type [Trinorchestia longiramus]|nr:Zinc finger FYVE/PHD-type [Trinorchestia longiramus]
MSDQTNPTTCSAEHQLENLLLDVISQVLPQGSNNPRTNKKCTCSNSPRAPTLYVPAYHRQDVNTPVLNVETFSAKKEEMTANSIFKRLGTGFYFESKIRRNILNAPYFQQSLEILHRNENLISYLGPPIGIGKVDLGQKDIITTATETQLHRLCSSCYQRLYFRCPGLFVVEVPRLGGLNPPGRTGAQVPLSTAAVFSAWRSHQQEWSRNLLSHPDPSTVESLLLRGGVHSNPRPQSLCPPAFPCSVCSCRVIERGVSFLCTSCHHWVHRRCSRLAPVAAYTPPWSCLSCSGLSQASASLKARDTPPNSTPSPPSTSLSDPYPPWSPPHHPQHQSLLLPTLFPYSNITATVSSIVLLN